MTAVTEFQGAYRFLSNFWPCAVVLDGVSYPSVEHAYVAAKTIDIAARAKIASMERPGDVKRFGRTISLRSDWDAVKLAVMRNLVAQKFSDPALRAKLLGTGRAKLEEGNTWGDTFWGVCRGKGENHLGRILMEIRDAV